MRRLTGGEGREMKQEAGERVFDLHSQSSGCPFVPSFFSNLSVALFLSDLPPLYTTSPSSSSFSLLYLPTLFPYTLVSMTSGGIIHILETYSDFNLTTTCPTANPYFKLRHVFTLIFNDSGYGTCFLEDKSP